LIKKLRLQNFKAYDKAELEFNPGFNLITGPNGVGKTSLLEGLAHLGFGSSPWLNRSALVVKEGTSYAIIDGRGEERGCEVKMRINRSGKKEVYISGKRAARLSELLGLFPMTAIGPQEIDLIKGSPGGRRRMMNSILCQMDKLYTDSLARYKKFLQDRNVTLKKVKNNEVAGGEVLLETIEENMAREAAVVMQHRDNFVNKLSKKSSNIYNDITGETGGEMGIEYQPTIRVENMGKGEIEKEYLKRISARRKRDIDTGETVIGPHRDDLLFKKNDEAMDVFGSWGQARIASISTLISGSQLLFKEREKSQKVSLLLDDCFAELDPENTERFLHCIYDTGQVFLVSPRPIDLPENIECSKFVFEGIGNIKEVD